MQTNDTINKNDAIIAVSPVHKGYLYDGNEDVGAFILIGYLGETAVYRTTHTLAHCKDKSFW